MKKIKSAFKNNKGATAIEYGLLVGMIGLALTASLSEISTSINSTFTTIDSGFDSGETPE